MAAAPSRTIRRAVAGLTPLVLIAAAMPLLAPTCGGFAPGVKTFARGSLIIPMDVCYQCTLDADSATDPAACGQSGYQTPAANGLTGGKVCPQATDAGDVVKAYGIVYNLIRNGVPVYWVINPAKTKLDDYDLTLQYNGGAPVYLYNWSNGSNGAAPTAQATINYMGGAFVVDGTDFARANAILQDPTKIDKTVFNTVNLHVSNIAFQADVARTMAGGWNAGGAVAPKLALVDIASSGSGTKNSYVVIAGYLQKAGLTSDINNPWPLGGTSAAGNHGQIYDRLTMEDFIPSTPGDWTTTKLYQNGYQALWVPHWVAPGSCSSCTKGGSAISCSNCGTSCTCTATYPAATVANALETIGSFVAAGKDLFAECAGLGSFEGGIDATHQDLYSGNDDPDIIAAQGATHFQTDGTPGPTGFTMTESTPGAPNFRGNFSNPLMQIGDFEFVPRSGAIATYAASDYKGETIRLVNETPSTGTKDIFTLVPAVNGGHGTIVYMGGHSYSGTDGTYHTAGTRLVLNTLFNLGASCVPTGTTCSTGALGVCGVGAMTCDGSGNQVCTPTGTATTETCNGLDDDCDGLVDENLARACYGGPAGTEDVGLCHGGQQQCVKNSDGSFGYGACVGSQVPATEICDNADNDCDNQTDEGLNKSCYTGPSSTLDPISGQPMGICEAGTQSCSAGAWGTCTGQTLPGTRECSIDSNAGNGQDDNCNGLVDEGCGCTSGTQQPCYSGPAGTMTNSPCQAGTQSCVAGAWGTCSGQVLPAAEVCGNDVDDDCDGVSDAIEPACNVCVAQPCYEGPAGTEGDGVCTGGTRACTDGVYGACLGQTLPSIEFCDGKDNDCDGSVDEGPPPCGDGLQCSNGVCVSEVCGAEQRCQQGYECIALTCVPVNDCCLGTLDVDGVVCCAVDLDGTGHCPGATAGFGTCAPGVVCRSGSCADPCDPDPCGEGTFCSGGVCTGGACYAEGCDAGQVCKNGSCAPDPCAGVACPGGTFCRDGDCVQACAYVTCLEGQICGDDGFCKDDPCEGGSCGAGRVCIDGSCADNLCTSVDCGADKICRQYRDTSGWTATCIDDPCAAVSCPTGLCLPRAAIDCTTEPCVRAQCFSAGNPGGIGTEPEKTDGCGCASGSPSPVALLLGLLLVPIARRRREPRGAGPLALLLAGGLTATLAGCPETKGTDPADCVQACNVDSIVAPWISSVSPPSGLKGSPAATTVTLTGARFEPGATLRIFPAGEITVSSVTVAADKKHVTAELDLSGASETQYLLRVVNPDRVISNLAPFDAVFMAPIVTGVTSSPAAPTAPVVATLTVTGSRFTEASECRVQAGTFTLTLPTTLQPTVPEGTELQCTLDTSKVPPGDVEVYVVNEGGRVSDRTPPFLITVAGPLSATAISPPSVAAECVNPPACTTRAVHAIVTIYGSGFDGTCVVKADGNNPPTTTRPKTLLDPTRLQAQIDITGIASTSLPLSLYLTVTKGAVTTVPALPFFAVDPTSTIQVDTLSPQSGYQGTANIPLLVSGTGIPVGTVVQILPPSGPNAGVWQALSTSGSGSSVTGTLNLSNTTNWPAGDYEVRLGFPDSTFSVTFPFSVLSNVPTLWSFTSTPAEQQQGTNVTVTVKGTTLFTGVKLRLITPTSARLSPTGDTTTFNPPDTLVATFPLSNLDTGIYQLVAFNTSSADSNPLSFSVAPGQPTLTSLSPTSASQSVPPPIVTVTLNGTNFAKPDATGVGGSIVFIRNPGLGIAPMAIPSDKVTVVDYDTIQVALDTRETVPSAGCASPYKVKVMNPGATLLETVERDFCVTP